MPVTPPGATVAMNVTVWPTFEGLADDTSEVVVVKRSTDWITAAGAMLGLNAVSPL